MPPNFKTTKLLYMNPETKALAVAFSDVLKTWLDPAEITEINRRNQLPEYKDYGCCASHDFCDSNMAMWEGFVNVYNREPVLNADDDLSRINRAWDMARFKQFYTQQTT